MENSTDNEDFASIPDPVDREIAQLLRAQERETESFLLRAAIIATLDE